MHVQEGCRKILTDADHRATDLSSEAVTISCFSSARHRPAVSVGQNRFDHLH